MESITEQLDNEMDTKIDLKNLEVEEVIMTNYTNCIPLATAKWLDLFDDIPYKYLKKLLEEEDDFIVEIEDMPCDRDAWCKTSFTFTLEYEADCNKNLEKEFTVIKEYNCSSAMALTIIELKYPDEDEEEEEKSWTVGDIDIEGYKNYMKREHEQLKRQQELEQEKNESESEEEELEFE